MDEIYTPFALKLYSFGLTRLLDWNWAGADLYSFTIDHVRGRVEPYELLRKPLKKGFLFHIGLWLYDDYVNNDDRFHVMDCEDLSWYLEDFAYFLIRAGCSEKDKLIKGTLICVKRIDELYSIENEDVYYQKLENSRSTFKILHERLTEKHKATISNFAEKYAANYADRLFHDRELCGYISQLLVTIGLTDEDKEGNPCQWAERVTFPEWIKSSLRARERGKCAMCGSDLVLELEDEIHIDHIVPLSKGGCNDLVNLQLLCKDCNQKKSNSEISPKSSILPYIQRHIQK